MSLLNPTALLLLLIALPITVLYVLRVRLRRAPVSSLMFWQKALAEQPPRAFWQRFRHLASWLVTLLLLALLTLSAADVRWSGRTALPQRTILVLDVSSGMAAAAAGASRLAEAQKTAISLIDGLSDHDEMAVIAAGSVPRILCGITSHQPTLRRAVTEARQTAGPAQLPEAVLLAQRLAAGTAASAGAAVGRVVVYSDGCGSEPPNAQAENAIRTQPDAASENPQPPSQPDAPVAWQYFGASQPNVGFTAFQLRRSDVDPLGYEIFMRLQNAADAAVTALMEIERNGAPLDVIPVEIEANGEWTRVVSKLSAEGGSLQATLTNIQFTSVEPSATPADGLAADNTAWAVLPARPRQRVLLVSPGSLFVQKVLEANPLVDLTVWRELPDNPVWPEGSLIVLHEIIPAVLPPGPVLVLDPRGPCDLWKLSGEAIDPVLESVQAASGWMRNVRLEQVLIPSASVLEFAKPPQVLAEAAGGVPLYVALKRARNGPVLVLPIRFAGSDLAYRTVFPILVANALNELSGGAQELTGAILAGDTARLVLPANNRFATEVSPGKVTRPYQLRAPSGTLQQLHATAITSAGDFAASESSDWQLITEPLLELGVWEVSDSLADATGPQQTSAGSRQPILEFAVNAAGESEVDLRPVVKRSSDSDASTRSDVGYSAGSPTAWLLLLALLLLAIEWGLHQRRWLA